MRRVNGVNGWVNGVNGWVNGCGVVAFCVVVSLLHWTALADEPPPSASVEGVVGYPQEHDLSCESRSATDLAAFWGVPFAEDDFFRRLPKSDNPYCGFLGDVDQPPGSMPPAGYGVYAGPIAATLRSFGLDAQARREWGLDDLRAELAAGWPVIVWATYDMRLPEIQSWVSTDGATSPIVQWQHTFIAVGYDDVGVYLVDAYDAATKHFTHEQFAPAWAQLGGMAVTVRGPSSAPGGRVWVSTVSTDAVSTVSTDTDGSHSQFVVDGRWLIGPE